MISFFLKKQGLVRKKELILYLDLHVCIKVLVGFSYGKTLNNEATSMIVKYVFLKTLCKILGVGSTEINNLKIFHQSILSDFL